MTKNKKELEEENKKLKDTLKIYNEFWETDVFKESLKHLIKIKNILIISSVLLLMFSMFLIGLCIN